MCNPNNYIIIISYYSCCVLRVYNIYIYYKNVICVRRIYLIWCLHSIFRIVPIHEQKRFLFGMNYFGIFKFSENKTK